MSKPSECPPPSHFQGELEKFAQIFAPSLHVQSQFGPLNSKGVAGRTALSNDAAFVTTSLIEIKIQFFEIIILYFVKVPEVSKGIEH